MVKMMSSSRFEARTSIITGEASRAESVDNTMRAYGQGMLDGCMHRLICPRLRHVVMGNNAIAFITPKNTREGQGDSNKSPDANTSARVNI